MTLEKIKFEVSKMMNKSVLIKVNIGRNKYEYIEGTINGVYPYLFTVKSNNEIKSYTYSDLLTKHVTLKMN